MELVDTLSSGGSAERHRGSTPLLSTNKSYMSEEPSSQEIVNDVFKSASFSDRLWFYLTKNIRIIKSVLYALISIFIFAGIYILVSNWNESRMHKAYVESRISDESKLKFAEAHSATNLGAMTFVELADKSYQDNNFEQSAKLYSDAIKANSHVEILSAKAKIGYAMSLVKLHKTQDAEKILINLESNKNYNVSLRAMAKLLLAQCYLSRNEMLLSKDCLNKMINDSVYAGYKSEAEELMKIINK